MERCFGGVYGVVDIELFFSMEWLGEAMPKIGRCGGGGGSDVGDV